jgi:hypothetical protein
MGMSLAQRLHYTMPGYRAREFLFRSVPARWLRAAFLASATARAMAYADHWQAVPPRVTSKPPGGRLQEFFAHRVDGPGIWKWQHYFDIYERHCAKFVGRPMHLLEVGVYSGGSLEMWRHYFGAQCQITGVDIEPAVQAYTGDGVRILVGDQGDPSFWRSVLPTLPRIDVVVDDGGHLPHQQIVTLEELLPHLNPGGVYICEDIHDQSRAVNAYTAGLLNRLNATPLAPHPDAPLHVIPSPFQATVHGVHCYPYMTVIEVREAALNELIAPRKGTQWQPFYNADHAKPPVRRSH